MLYFILSLARYALAIAVYSIFIRLTIEVIIECSRVQISIGFIRTGAIRELKFRYIHSDFRIFPKFRVKALD